MFADERVKSIADVPVLLSAIYVMLPSLRHTKLLLFRKFSKMSPCVSVLGLPHSVLWQLKSTKINMWLGLMRLL